MIHIAFATTKAMLERTSLDGFYCFWQQRKLSSSEALGGISICKPSAAGFALVEIKMQRESKGRNKSTKKQITWHRQERERIITKPGKTFVRQDRTYR